MGGTGSAKPQDRCRICCAQPATRSLHQNWNPRASKPQDSGCPLPLGQHRAPLSAAGRKWKAQVLICSSTAPLAKLMKPGMSTFLSFPSTPTLHPACLKENSRKKESGLDCGLRPSPATPLCLWARSLTEISLSRKEEKQIVVTYVGKGDCQD